MFDIAWSEFLVVAVVALVVVGPKDLPALLRTVGRTVASLRRMAGEFQGQFHEAMREAELDDLKNDLTGMKDKASRMVGASPFQIARDEIKNALTDKPKTTPSALAGDGAAAAKADAGDVPSALAPPPAEEPPAPAEADFGIRAAPAMRPVETPPAKPRDEAAKAARAAASTSDPTAKPAPRKRAPKAAADGPAEAPPPAAKTRKVTTGKAATSKSAADAAAKPAPKKKPQSTPPGASA